VTQYPNEVANEGKTLNPKPLNVITDEEKDSMFTSEPELFSIGTISLPLKTLDIVVISIV
jgi:hypothetical protein